jgi:hypothetical protein
MIKTENRKVPRIIIIWIAIDMMELDRSMRTLTNTAGPVRLIKEIGCYALRDSKASF